MIALVLATCVAVPVGWVAWPLVAGTINADKGQGSPNAALIAFVQSFNDAPDAIGVDRLIVAERREQVGRQRREYMTAMAADRKATGGAIRFEAGTEEPGDGTVVHGDRAAVVDSYRVVWMPSADDRATAGGLALWYNGTPCPVFSPAERMS